MLWQIVIVHQFQNFPLKMLPFNLVQDLAENVDCYTKISKKTSSLKWFLSVVKQKIKKNQTFYLILFYLWFYLFGQAGWVASHCVMLILLGG